MPQNDPDDVLWPHEWNDEDEVQFLQLVEAFEGMAMDDEIEEQAEDPTVDGLYTGADSSSSGSD